MKTVLIYAGTTEGRNLAEIFDRSGISCHVCVATAYGRQLLQPSKRLTIHEGRLDEAGMRALMKEIDCRIVVDATHPYAAAVTSEIKKSIEGLDIPYLRLLRGNDAKLEGCDVCVYDSVKQCADALSDTEGAILLTTGSKQIHEFTENPWIKDRLIARVIPGIESLTLCYDAGLLGRQILAMQGPFSKEMNEVIIKDYEIKHLVTKESGVTGGVDSKAEAAAELGVQLHVIRRPEELESVEDMGLSMKETLNALEQLLGVTFVSGRMLVTLAGIGPGSREMMTGEVVAAIKDADVIFGAKRMLDSIDSRAKKYPYYRKEEILPVLRELANGQSVDTKAVVLFSGDTGFYSGSKKMQEALCSEDFDVRVLPGISSISVLAARLGTDWQDAKILSLHGVRKEQWIPKITDFVRRNRKTFFITSGVEDLHLLGELLEEEFPDREIYLGYQMSYPEEKIVKMTPNECRKLKEGGLYTGMIAEEKERPHCS